MNTRKLILLTEVSSKNHYSMFDSWLEICRFNEWDFGIVVTKSIYENLTDNVKTQSKFIYVLDDGSLLSLLEINRISKQKKVDIINFLSIQSDYISFAFFLTLFVKVPYVVSIHNANAWFKPKYIYKEAKYILKSISRALIKLRCSGFIVNSKNMYDYSINLTSKNLYIVPFSLRRYKYSSKLDLPISIVYPGMVSVSRKNYDIFFELARLNPTIKFIILGRVDNKSKHILEEANRIDNIEVRDYYIPHDEYSKVMSSSRLIFTDMKVEYSSDGFDEIYGVTKDSGVSYLMLEYQKKAMLNSSFNNFSSLLRDSLYFSDLDEAIIIFNNIISERANLDFESDNFNVNEISNQLSNL